MYLVLSYTHIPVVVVASVVVVVIDIGVVVVVSIWTLDVSKISSRENVQIIIIFNANLSTAV